VIEANYTNLGSANTTGIVFSVVRNALGQTVEYSTATVQIASGGISTAYLVVFGLPGGQYSASLFAVYPSGVALSTTTTIAITVAVAA